MILRILTSHHSMLKVNLNHLIRSQKHGLKMENLFISIDGQEQNSGS